MSSICTECFLNFGVKETVKKLCKNGKPISCLNCGSHVGKQVDTETAIDVMGDFFVNGSVPPEIGGPAPVFHYNSSKHSQNVTFGTNIDHDLNILSKFLDVSLFHYGPPLWRLGFTDHYQKLKGVGPEEGLKDVVEREKIWDEIIGRCKVVNFDDRNKIFRLRSGRELVQATPEQFDTPPAEFVVSRGRYDSDSLPIFYASDDVEVCIHECRATLADSLTLGTLVPNRPIRLIDLSDSSDESALGTEFQSVTRMLVKLAYSGKQDYDLCRELAQHIKKRGFDGFLFLSYFSQAHKRKLKNLALFGYPLKSGLLRLESVNRLILEYVGYEYSFGPHNDQYIPPDAAEFEKIADQLRAGEITGYEASERMQKALNRKSKGPR